MRGITAVRFPRNFSPRMSGLLSPAGSDSESETMTPQEKKLTQRSQTFHHHELRRMRRAAEAKQLGLDVHEFAMPWPGNQVTTNHNSAGGFWKGALLAAGLLTGGLTGGAFLASHLLPSTPTISPKPPANQPAEEPATKTNTWDYEIDMQVIPPKADPKRH